MNRNITEELCKKLSLIEYVKPFFKVLEQFSTDLNSIRNNNFFVGYDQRELGILQALEFYDKMNGFDKRTKSKDLGEHIFNMALQADIVSILFQNFPDSPLFTSHEFSFVAYSHQDYLLNLVERLKAGTKESVEAMSIF